MEEECGGRCEMEGKVSRGKRLDEMARKVPTMVYAKWRESEDLAGTDTTVSSSCFT
jgi:hypothetical protein